MTAGFDVAGDLSSLEVAQLLVGRGSVKVLYAAQHRVAAAITVGAREWIVGWTPAFDWRCTCQRPQCAHVTAVLLVVTPSACLHASDASPVDERPWPGDDPDVDQRRRILGLRPRRGLVRLPSAPVDRAEQVRDGADEQATSEQCEASPSAPLGAAERLDDSRADSLELIPAGPAAIKRSARLEGARGPTASDDVPGEQAKRAELENPGDDVQRDKRSGPDLRHGGILS